MSPLRVRAARLERVERPLKDARALLQHEPDESVLVDAVLLRLRRRERRDHRCPVGGEVFWPVAGRSRALAQLGEQVEEAMEDGLM
eukprot:6200923-Pleurochrysis_carterae.AAC.4